MDFDISSNGEASETLLHGVRAPQQSDEAPRHHAHAQIQRGGLVRMRSGGVDLGGLADSTFVEHKGDRYARLGQMFLSTTAAVTSPSSRRISLDGGKLWTPKEREAATQSTSWRRASRRRAVVEARIATVVEDNLT